MFDTIQDVTAMITRMLRAGTPEQALLAAVAWQFPQLTVAELSQALQVAQAAAERKVTVKGLGF